MHDFPSAITKKRGWPCDANVPKVNGIASNSRTWPRVSVVTPSYNQAQYIEETIRSVLLQGYPNLEYILIDGGSTDGSVETIRRYEAWMTYWVSEKDRGMCHAINKGWTRATGEILAWLNSDDLYLPGGIYRAVLALEACNDCALVYGDGLRINESGRVLDLLKSAPLDIRLLLTGKSQYGIPQPTVFMKRSAVEEVNGLDEAMVMAMDYDLWLKIALRRRLHYIEGPPLAALRLHCDQKTQRYIYEDRKFSLVALDRALVDSRCPKEVSKRESVTYTKLHLDLAVLVCRKNKGFRSSIRYFMGAFANKPFYALKIIISDLLVGLFRMITPEPLKRAIRRMRRIDVQTS